MSAFDTALQVGFTSLPRGQDDQGAGRGAHHFGWAKVALEGHACRPCGVGSAVAHESLLNLDLVQLNLIQPRFGVHRGLQLDCKDTPLHHPRQHALQCARNPRLIVLRRVPLSVVEHERTLSEAPVVRDFRIHGPPVRPLSDSLEDRLHTFVLPAVVFVTFLHLERDRTHTWGRWGH